MFETTDVILSTMRSIRVFINMPTIGIDVKTHIHILYFPDPYIFYAEIYQYEILSIFIAPGVTLLGDLDVQRKMLSVVPIVTLRRGRWDIS